MMNNTDRRKNNREYYKMNHRCTKCGTKDARTEHGRSHCERCAEIDRKNTKNTRTNIRDKINWRKRD